MGRKYFMRVGWYPGKKWTSIAFEPSGLWQSDEHVEFTTDWFTYQEMVTVEGKGGRHNNGTLLENAGNHTSGDNVVYINRDANGTKESGGNVTYYVDGGSSVSLRARTCWGTCEPPPPPYEPPTTTPEAPRDPTRYWSNPDDWDNLPGRIPIDGDEIEIRKGWIMVFDILESPRLKGLEINGHLSLAEGADRSINAYKIWVRAGTF